jgi:L-gulono-1,4-lactone dehydrogenase
VGGWRNWAGNQQATPVQVAHPVSQDELVGVVAAAARDGLRVKAVGSGHSFTGVAVTDGVLVRLDRYAELVHADQPSGLVTVQAGMPLWRLGDLLAELGLAMTNLGDIDRQTVAGAISTGTHGTGSARGGLGSQVHALELVLADGSVVRCSAEEQPDLLAAASVGLGALGLISTVTLRCEPAFGLHAVEAPMRLDEVLERLDELVDENQHFELFWFPHSDWTLTRRNNRVPAGEPLRPLPRLKAWLDDELLSNTVFGLTCRLGRRAPRLVRPLNRAAARTLGARDYADRSDRVFASSRRVRFVEMEHGVPREHGAELIREVRRLIERLGLAVSFPVQLRFAAADEAWLSTAHRRPSAYVAVHQFVGVPYERYFREVEAVAGAAGGRPHWGKVHWLGAAELRQRYPRFDDFVAVRDRLDPQGRFANAYLDQVLGRAPAAR